MALSVPGRKARVHMRWARFTHQGTRHRRTTMSRNFPDTCRSSVWR